MISVAPVSSLKGEITVPGDKSISHRSIMFGALAKGTTRVKHFLEGADCLSTIACFQKMGVSIEKQGEEYLVHGRGLHGLMAPSDILDCGNSGTTTRLLSGILAGQAFSSVLTGDASIQKRLCPACHHGSTAAWHYLPHARGFRTGQIRHPFGRFVCGFPNNRGGAGAFTQSHGNHASFFRRIHFIKRVLRHRAARGGALRA